MVELTARDPFAGGSVRAVAEAWTDAAAPKAPAEAKQAPAPVEDVATPLGEKPAKTAEASEPQDAADEVSTETESATEPEAPAIAAPSGWTDDEKSLWTQLSPEVQRAIARKSTDADRAFTSKTTELAEQRKQIAAIEAQYRQGLTERFQKLDQLIQTMDTKEPDWQAILDQEGVVSLNSKRIAWEAQQKQSGAIKAERDRIANEMNQRQQHEMLTYAESQHRALADAWPEFFDAEKSKALRPEINSYLTEKGYSTDEINSALDHRAFLVLQDALKYRALQKAKPDVEKRLREAPKMQKSGPSSESADRDADATRKARQMVKQHPGDRKAIAGLLGRHLSK